MKRFERTRRRRVGRIDVAASALSRLAPRGLRGRIDRLRLDARAVVDGFRPEREPTYAAPGTPPSANRASCAAAQARTLSSTSSGGAQTTARRRPTTAVGASTRGAYTGTGGSGSGSVTNEVSS